MASGRGGGQCLECCLAGTAAAVSGGRGRERRTQRRRALRRRALAALRAGAPVLPPPTRPPPGLEAGPWAARARRSWQSVEKKIEEEDTEKEPLGAKRRKVESLFQEGEQVAQRISRSMQELAGRVREDLARCIRTEVLNLVIFVAEIAGIGTVQGSMVDDLVRQRDECLEDELVKEG
eukprot:3706440-Lingulodinium_polyedra.AAC.1